MAPPAKACGAGRLSARERRRRGRFRGTDVELKLERYFEGEDGGGTTGTGPLEGRGAETAEVEAAGGEAVEAAGTAMTAAAMGAVAEVATVAKCSWRYEWSRTIRKDRRCGLRRRRRRRLEQRWAKETAAGRHR